MPQLVFIENRAGVTLNFKYKNLKRISVMGGMGLN